MINGFQMIFSEKEKNKITNNIRRVLDSGMVIDHDFHGKLRSNLKSLTGKKFCDFSSSNTMISEILYRVLDLENIIFQGNMFVSPIFASRRAGMKIEFVDIELETLGMNPNSLKSINLNNKLLCMMHTGGIISKNTKEIVEHSHLNNSIVIEDCAQSFGSKYDDIHCGTIGDYGVFSFASTKIFTSINGGAVVHNDREIHDQIHAYTNCGKRTPFGEQVCDYEGFSARLTEIQSSILCGLDLNWRLNTRKKCAEIYNDYLSPFEGDVIRKIYHYKENNNYRFFILFCEGFNITSLEEYAESEGWMFSPPVFRELPYKTPVFNNQFKDVMLPNAEYFSGHHVCLPVHEGMSENDSVYVAKSLVKFMNEMKNIKI